MSLFNFSVPEILTFFAVLVRYSVLFSVLPFVGDHHVPMPVKILLSLSVSLALFPGLVARGYIHPNDALIWGATAGGIVGTIATEVLLGLVLGYVARLAFDSISFGGNLVGNFMGFGLASSYDPEQQSQTQVVAEIQMALAMLIFLVLDGHHLMLRASLESYQLVGIGGLGSFLQHGLNKELETTLVALTGQVILFGIQLSAPVAVVLFGVNIVFGILAKAMPQLNILVLSVTVSAIIGLAVMFLTIPEFQNVSANILLRMEDSMLAVLRAIRDGG